MGPSATAAQPPDESGLSPGAILDANATSYMFMPTALTPPGGSFGFHSYELFFVGASYAISDHFLLSATALVPIVPDLGFNGILSAKYQVLADRRLKIALHGSYGILGSDADFSAGLVGGVATLCFNDDCTSHASGYAAVGLASADQSTFPVSIAGGAVLRVAKKIRLLAEIDSGLVTGEINDVSSAFLVWYGVRFASSSISADFGFVLPATSDGPVLEDFLPMGWPIVSFTFRSD